MVGFRFWIVKKSTFWNFIYPWVPPFKWSISKKQRANLERKMKSWNLITFYIMIFKFSVFPLKTGKLLFKHFAKHALTFLPIFHYKPNIALLIAFVLKISLILQCNNSQWSMFRWRNFFYHNFMHSFKIS